MDAPLTEPRDAIQILRHSREGGNLEIYYRVYLYTAYFARCFAAEASSFLSRQKGTKKRSRQVRWPVLSKHTVRASLRCSTPSAAA